MNKLYLGAAALLLSTMTACMSTFAGPATFGEDVAFLKGRVDTIVLSDAKGEAKIAVVPAYQGRVMTSTAAGNAGRSHGWVNRELIASGKPAERIHAFGGEDRFWIGPEGGQFSIFFAPGSGYDFDDWYTPAPIDTEPFELVESTSDRAVLKRRFTLTNKSSTRFEVEIAREIRLREAAQVLAAMRTELPEGVRGVAFESVNTITNVGRTAWKKETGLLSIWILGMFEASPATTVVVPFQTGPTSARGRIVNDEYFGKVPPERLRIDEARGLLLFKGDARHRSKIGVGPKRARDVLGSWDERNEVLTIVHYSLPRNPGAYVNSLWRHQDDPYDGDVVNSYNDGPAKPGEKGFGNFYELETSSPALALGPNEKATHSHRTIHLVGDRDGLARVAKSVLGVELEELDELEPARDP